MLIFREFLKNEGLVAIYPFDKLRVTVPTSSLLPIPYTNGQSGTPVPTAGGA